MKILKVFGIVVGIHVFALILIFANPGCSSTTKPTPADTTVNTASTEPSPVVSVPTSSPSLASDSPADLGTTPIVAAPLDYGNSSAGVRFTPTRPGSAAATAVQGPPPVTDVTPVSTYTVVKGDSLWSIAKKHHITVAELAAANHISAGTPVRVNQKLIVPGHTPVVPTPANASASTAKASESNGGAKAATANNGGTSVTHVVKAGETLGAIARKYGVKVGSIALANNISDPAKIRPGMELTIPGASNSSRSAKASPSSTSGANNGTSVNLAPATTTTAPASTGEPVKPFFTPPPADRDLDSGIQPGATEAPVIQIEEPAKQ